MPACFKGGFKGFRSFAMLKLCVLYFSDLSADIAVPCMCVVLELSSLQSRVVLSSGM